MSSEDIRLIRAAHDIGTLSKKPISSQVTVFWKSDQDGDLSLSR